MNKANFFTPKVMINLLSLIVIVLAIPVGIYLTLHHQSTKSSAAAPNQTHIELFGPHVSGGQASSTNIKVRLTYLEASSSGQSLTPPAFPSSFRIANSMDSLPYASQQLFSQNNQEIDWQLPFHPGNQTVYVQFKVNDVWSKVYSQSVLLTSSPPSFKFKLGANLTNVNISPTDMDKTLQNLANNQIQLVRVFVGYSNILDDQSAVTLGDFLTIAEKYNISVIPVLIDETDTSFHPQSTSSYYSQTQPGQRSTLDYTFFDQGYQSSYLDFVQKVVTLNAPHNNIFAWEIGNELKNPTNPSNLITFFQTVSAAIKGFDPNHLVALGVASSADSGLLPLQLYSSLDNIDLVTVHLKDNQPQPVADLNWAKQHQKSLIVEDTQPDLLNQQSFWQSQGAIAFFNNSLNQ